MNKKQIKDFYYTETKASDPNAVLLLDVGWVTGTRASLLKVDDVILWHYKLMYKVQAIKPLPNCLQITLLPLQQILTNYRSTSKQPLSYLERRKKGFLFCILKPADHDN